MISKDPPDPRGQLYGPASFTTASSSFPSHSSPPDPCRPSYSSPHPSEPLLPYARHPVQAFDQYPAEAERGILNLGASLLAGRGKLRVLAVLAGASVLFLLHSHLYRLRHILWEQPSNEHFPGLPQDFTPPSIHDADHLPPILAATPQARRKVRPSGPDPWEDLPKEWEGRAWLAEERFAGGKGMEDPPELRSPPAQWIAKAFEWAASQAGRGREPAGRRSEERTGRPVRVPHAKLFMGKGWRKPAFDLRDVGKGRGLPNVQVEERARDGREEEESERREWVRRAFLHTWEGYKKHAWGHDELKPVSKGFSDSFNGWGATIVDSLDTLLLMNLSHEYSLAREHVSSIDFSYLVPSARSAFSTVLPPIEDMELPESPQVDDGPQGAPRRPMYNGVTSQHSPTTIPTFETTIRYLGGLLSAFDLSGDPLMLERAIILGDWILPALGTEYGLAVGRYTLGSNPEGKNAGRQILSEVGSLTLEFTRLSMLCGDNVYYEAVQRAMDTLDKRFATVAQSSKGALSHGRLGTLLPTYVDSGAPESTAGDFLFGGLADSYYEYLIKQHQLLGGAHPQYERMYTEAIDSAHEHLIRNVEVVPGREDLMIVGEQVWGRWKPALTHLACFAGGMLGLGAKLLGRPLDLSTGLNITAGCAWAYESTATGLGPEGLVFFEPEEPSRYTVTVGAEGSFRTPRGSPVVGIKTTTPQYIGRPETIESVFYAYRLTGDRKWQDQGWKMFTSWIEHAITPSGFAAIANVYSDRARQVDSMESFVLAETLKYYFLLFSPTDFLSLDDWVFNTEAHPFRIPKPNSAPARFWTGPEVDASPTSSFASTMGEGTVVQKWARVRQAAVLVKAARTQDVPPPKGRTPIRPTEEELERAKGKEKVDVHAYAKEKMAGEMGGGGRGMGGSGRRPA